MNEQMFQVMNVISTLSKHISTLITPRQTDIENITWLRGNMKFISSVNKISHE